MPGTYISPAETGFYYLNSRYYDPEIGRFVNADSVISASGESIQGYNLFSYCFNNPINMIDSDGNMPKWLKGVVNWFNENVVQPIVDFVEDCFTVNHDVPLYNQGNTNLCWAYSQTMVEDFNSGTTRTAEEADERAREIAIDRHGEQNWNQPGRPSNLTEVRNVSLENIYYSLKKHGPLYASYGLYQEGERISGHAVIITGVDLINRRVYTNNPWGITGDQSYDEFLVIFEGTTEAGWRLDSCYYFE